MDTARKRPGGRSAAKRADVLRGALFVFGRDGYSRASIESIAAAAQVSTRTIYNHWPDKAALFEAVIVDSASRVSASRVDLIARHLDVPTPDLRAFARAWARPDPAFADHFAMVRQVQAEVLHVPHTALEAWLDSGPRTVQAALRRRLARLAEAGVLDIADLGIATSHFIALVENGVVVRTFHGALPISATTVRRLADAGLDAFLRSYGPGAHATKAPTA